MSLARPRATTALSVLSLLIFACSDEPAPSSGGQQVSELSSADGVLSAVLTVNNDWGGGYCANIRLLNTGKTATTSWKVVVKLPNSSFSNGWNATYTPGSGQVTAQNLGYNGSLASGASADIGFCANATSSAHVPVIESVTQTGGTGGSTTPVVDAGVQVTKDAAPAADTGTKPVVDAGSAPDADAAVSVDTGVDAGTGGKAFNQCRFHFGATHTAAKANGLASQLDYFVPGWMGQSDSFDMGYVCNDANGPLKGLTPAIVSYVIAFTARRDQKLQDCDVSSTNNLCTRGASFIRDHLEDRIIPQYRMYAKGFASCYGKTKPIIFMMEPDYYQYTVGGDPRSLTPKEAGQIMQRLVATIRAELPNAIFSLDISPWIPNNGRDWYPNFNMADFTFINTSGGRSEAANTKISSNNTMTWAGVHQVTGKPILADAGYGVAGAGTGHDANWDSPTNLNARMQDGLVGVAQYNPNASWATTIGSMRSKLNAPKTCP